MGRAPCCDKANVKKGPWSPEEDAKLKAYIEHHGTGGNWIALPQKIGLKRCGKSCRLRWLNYLRPNIKHGGFSEEEDNIICSLYISIGSRWSIIAAQLPGRTDNDIKNYWNTRLKKKFLGKQRKENGRRASSSSSSSNHNSNGCRNPIWPELPVLAPTPFSDHQNSFNDHASIRKLLIKLGGRFSNDDEHLIHNPQLFPTLHPTPNTLPDQCINRIPLSSPEGQNYDPVFGHHDWFEDQVLDLQTLEGQNIHVSAGFEENLEFLVGDDMMNNVESATYEGTMIHDCLDEIRSWVNPPLQVDRSFRHDLEMEERLMVEERGFVNEMGSV